MLCSARTPLLKMPKIKKETRVSSTATSQSYLVRVVLEVVRERYGGMLRGAAAAAALV